ncbi:hypothetical protein [Nannocystis sp. SCPEA4]|uniref:hypothetical protein n=1 Tax=Nannocystis sp. SCPEA4 TaxID=2996787 RepID=UPI00226FC36D|nr:hypothetical protein [Nannocystis sp. SCPEA4]MCY1057796.1 hypothetical protein [Nannocystis sp. SCPEA4]
MSTPRAVLLTLLLGATACGGDKPSPARTADPVKTAEPAKAAEPAKPASPTAVDRSKDPAFALEQDGDHYLGPVRDACPDGAHSAPAPKVAPAVADGKLRLELPFGGCPTWQPYSVVVGKGSPLPFYVCVDPEADKCELASNKTWLFDIGAALQANSATEVTYSVPAGVH